MLFSFICYKDSIFQSVFVHFNTVQESRCYGNRLDSRWPKSTWMMCYKLTLEVRNVQLPGANRFEQQTKTVWRLPPPPPFSLGLMLEMLKSWTVRIWDFATNRKRSTRKCLSCFGFFRNICVSLNTLHVCLVLAPKKITAIGCKWISRNKVVTH